MLRTSPLVVCCLFSLACTAGADSGKSASAGWLSLDGGERCVVDDGDLVGFCGQSDATFWGDGSTQGDCGAELSATVWMHPESWRSGSHTLTPESTELGSGEASVWFDVDGETFVSSAGTARTSTQGDDTVTIRFSATSMVTFLGGDATSHTAAGEVLCTLD